jgi:hypothetical protein
MLITISSVSTSLLVSRLEKVRYICFFIRLQFLLHLNLREGLDDVAHLDIVEVNQ